MTPMKPTESPARRATVIGSRRTTAASTMVTNGTTARTMAARPDPTDCSPRVISVNGTTLFNTARTSRSRRIPRFRGTDCRATKMITASARAPNTSRNAVNSNGGREIADLINRN
jgi:hypothetical protein